METKQTRKEFLVNSAKVAAGLVVGGGILGSLNNHVKASPTTAWPWPYQALDTEKAMILGHDAYYTYGCSYGAFHAIIQQLRDLIGEPFNSLPTEIMIYGKGGCCSWGTLCGALNGAAAAICLVCDNATSTKLISELLGWYTQTNIPTDASNQLGVDKKYTQNKYDKTLPQNKSGSPLCHVSITEWCNVAKFGVGSTEMRERCGRLTGDVAAYAIKLLNDNLAGKFVATWVMSDSQKACKVCHAGSTYENIVITNMECTPCHTTFTHPAGVSVREVGAPTNAYILNQNYPNPFNPNTSIQFSIPKTENVHLAIYDSHGRLVKNLIEGKEYSAGLYEVNWDGKNELGQKVSSGVYFSKIFAGKFNSTNKMVLTK